MVSNLRVHILGVTAEEIYGMVLLAFNHSKIIQI